MATTEARRPAPGRRGPLRWVLGSYALLALCGIALGAVGAGLWRLTRRGTVEAGEPTVEYEVDASTRMALPAEASLTSRLTVARGVLAEIVRPSAIPGLICGLREMRARLHRGQEEWTSH